MVKSYTYGQDTLRFKSKPEVVLKSWYPEFQNFPKLKLGQSKVLFTTIPNFEKTLIRDNDINLVVKDNLVKIQETDKTNQFIVTVTKSDILNVDFEIWFEIGILPIFILENSKWMDIRKIYPLRNNRVMLQKVRLDIEK